MRINKYTFEVAPVRFNIHVPEMELSAERIDRIALRALYKQEVIGIEDIECIAKESYEESDDDNI